MQTCQKCKINIRGNKAICPLCQSKLTGEPENPAFPTIKHNRVTSFTIIRIAVFFFFVVEICMGAAWFLAKHEQGKNLFWVPLVMAGTVVALADLVVTIYLRNNILKIITFEVYVAILVDLAIDVHFGFAGWSVVFVIPFSFIGLGAATISIGMASKMKSEDFVIYLVLDTIFSLFQIIPILRGNNYFEWPAVICMALYLILAAGMFLFHSRELKNASAKYFNV